MPDLAYRAIWISLAHTLFVLAAGIGIFRLARKRPSLAGALAVAMVAADLAVANSRLILTSPQSLYEGVPETLRHIQEAESKDPADGPFRIHRMPIWNPLSWHLVASNSRAADYTKWERDTIQPKYGITEGVEYTQTMGVTELYDYEWFFAPFERKARAQIAQLLSVPIDTPIAYFPRRAFDMWNTRYFIVPQFPNRWTDAGRGYASFLTGNIDRIFPAPTAFNGEEGKEKLREWIDTMDYQIFRNYDAYPRAWVVHEYRAVKGISGMNRDNREGPMYEMVYADDPIWKDSERRVFNPREIAWIDEGDLPSLQNFRSAGLRASQEEVRVKYPDPQHVVLDCRLETPGMVILSDVYYPGWELTIDDKPAPIYRANRLMRGAAVPAGTHRLVYSFRPLSFRLGLALSVVSILVSCGLGALLVRRGTPATPIDRMNI
jgi:hypothetical protein